MDRFKNATLEIRDFLLEMTVFAMMQGAWLTSFQESLSLDPLKSLADNLDMDWTYVMNPGQIYKRVLELNIPKWANINNTGEEKQSSKKRAKKAHSQQATTY